jgi:2-amino-4-hydroxy-6-hydroxymethyldihydropteridine diphosphokinase
LSWPNPKNPKFLNIVIKVNTKLKPKILLSICKKIEILIGRRVSLKNSPRECDIDIIDYDNLQSKNGIILPHPRMHKRNFVLFPLFEINKNWKHPLSRNNIKKLIYSLSNKDITSIKKI